MAQITNATRAWQSVTLATSEIWQVRDGEVYVDTDANEATRLGIIMNFKDSIALPPGTVFYRLGEGTSAIIARVAV